MPYKCKAVGNNIAAKSLQSCPTLYDPIDGSPPGSPVPGILQQEHWSGLPFPSPMHESEKWKWSRSVVSDPQRPHGLQPSRLLRPWDFLSKSTGVGCHCLLQGNNIRPLQLRWHLLNSSRFLRTKETSDIFVFPSGRKYVTRNIAVMPSEW